MEPTPRWLGWFRNDITEDVETKYVSYRDYTGYDIKYIYICPFYLPPHKVLIVSRTTVHSRNGCCCSRMLSKCLYCHSQYPKIESILPKGPYSPCLRMADRALLAGYPRNMNWKMSQFPTPVVGACNRCDFESNQGYATFRFIKFQLFQEQLFTVKMGAFSRACWYFVC